MNNENSNMKKLNLQEVQQRELEIFKVFLLSLFLELEDTVQEFLDIGSTRLALYGGVCLEMGI